MILKRGLTQEAQEREVRHLSSEELRERPKGRIKWGLKGGFQDYPLLSESACTGGRVSFLFKSTEERGGNKSCKGNR